MLYVDEYSKFAHCETFRVYQCFRRITLLRRLERYNSTLNAVVNLENPDFVHSGQGNHMVTDE